MTKDRYWRMLAATVVVCVFACECGEQPAVDHGGKLVSEEGRIAFTRVSGFGTSGLKKSDIYAIDADASQEERLTDTPGLDGFPTWSPDGDRIAFTVYPGGAEQLAVIDGDGTDEHRLTGRFLAMGPNSEAAWSPDGKRMAFVSGRNDEDIYAMNSDGSERTRLTDDVPGNDHWPPTWSPDSARIAFTSDGPGRGDIYVMNSDGSGLTKLTDDPAYDAFPAWRP
jgi:Tol biopolymer transport system component